MQMTIQVVGIIALALVLVGVMQTTMPQFFGSGFAISDSLRLRVPVLEKGEGEFSSRGTVQGTTTDSTRVGVVEASPSLGSDLSVPTAPTESVAGVVLSAAEAEKYAALSSQAIANSPYYTDFGATVYYSSTGETTVVPSDYFANNDSSTVPSGEPVVETTWLSGLGAGQDPLKVLQQAVDAASTFESEFSSSESEYGEYTYATPQQRADHFRALRMVLAGEVVQGVEPVYLDNDTVSVLVFLKRSPTAMLKPTNKQNVDAIKSAVQQQQNAFVQKYASSGFVHRSALSVSPAFLATFKKGAEGIQLANLLESDVGLVDTALLDGIIHVDLVESRVQTKANIVENTLGYDGAGTEIAILDTGLDYTQPALNYPGYPVCTTAQVVAGTCPRVHGFDYCASHTPLNPCATTDSDPMDEYGHGTFVAGVAGSSDSTYRGIAPNATFHALKVFNSVGNGTYSAVISALDSVAATGYLTNTRSVNMSFGAGGSFSLFQNANGNCWYLFDPSFQALTNAGISLVAASGNKWVGLGIGYPACADNVIGVGASYDTTVGTQTFSTGLSPGSPSYPSTCTDVNPTTNQLTCFSQSSFSMDMVAPGAIITSAASSIGSACGAGFGTGLFFSCNGTSFATPMVAGAINLVAQANPSLTPRAIKTILTSTGSIINDAYPNPQPSSTSPAYLTMINGTTATTFPGLNTLAAVNASSRPIITPNVARPEYVAEQYFLSVGGSPDYRYPIHVSEGETITFSFEDPGHANMPYILFISVTPGAFFIAPGKVIPLAPDGVFYVSIVNPNPYGLHNSQSVLDASGKATVSFTIPYGVPHGIEALVSGVVLDLSLPYPDRIVGIAPLTKFRVGKANLIHRVAATLPNPPLFAGSSGTSCASSGVTSSIDCFTFSHASSFGDALSGPTLGTPQYLSTLVRYDPVQDTTTIMNTSVPIPASLYTATPTDPGYVHASCEEYPPTGVIYCFGGLSGREVISLPWGGTVDRPLQTKAIFAYNPIADIMTVQNAVLPDALTITSCNYSAQTQKIYCIGGRKNMTYLAPVPPSLSMGVVENGNTQVFEYDPATDTLITKTAVVPTYNYSAGTFQINRAAYWCDGHDALGKIYCYTSGTYAGHTASSLMFEYDVALDAFNYLTGINPPSGYTGTCYLSNNEFAPVSGLFQNALSGNMSIITRPTCLLKYDPVGNQFTYTSATQSYPMALIPGNTVYTVGGGVFGINNKAYLVGGYTAIGTGSEQIYSVDLP